MKNYSLLSILLVGLFGVMTSCSSNDCHECHIALYNAAGAEVAQHEIGEYCGDDLEDVESAGYDLEDTVFYSFQDTNYTLLPGLVPGLDVHCEEDHSGHDH